MIIRIVLVLLLLAPLLGCGRGEASFTLRRSGPDLLFSGRITPEAADEILSEMGGVRKLVIFSTGGDVDAAIRIGHAVIDGEVTVEVDTLCASSCAHYVFAVAPAKIVRDQSVVIFHTSPFSWEHLIEQGYISDADVEFSNNEDLFELKALYSKAGVSPDVLVCASRLIELRPQTVRTAPGGGVRVNTRYAGVYFGREMLDSFGIDNVTQAYDFSDGDRLAFQIDGRFVKVAQQAECERSVVLQ